MAVPANTFQTYGAVGNREDLTDILTIISPTDTPFMSGVGKGVPAKATLHEWQTDELKPADGDNKHVEGDDTTIEAQPPTKRLGNYTQIMKKTARVSGTQESVDTAGRKKEMAYQKMKRTKELARDMEARLTGNYARNAGDAATPRELASVESFITISNAGGGGADPAGDGTNARTDGTQRAFTEAMLNDVIDAAWFEGGAPDMVIMGPHTKKVSNAFGGIADHNIDIAGGSKPKATGILNAVDWYVSDTGSHRMVRSRFSRPRSALVLEMARWKLAYLRKGKWKKLARTGDSMAEDTTVEFTLECRAPLASGIVADLLTS